MTTRAALLFALALAPACGGGSTPTRPAPMPTPAPRSALVTATGAGFLVLSPSAARTHSYAIRTPVRIQESGGGEAKWGFARLSLMRAGREVERAELGANVLASPPDWTNIGANSNAIYPMVFRLNSDQFDQVLITLGMTDKATGRIFEVNVPFSTFSGVTTSPVAQSLPTRFRLPLP